MNLNNILGLLIPGPTWVFVLGVLTSCAEDEPSKPDTTPDNKPDTVITVDVPEIAPLVCDFNSNDDSLSESGWTKVFEDNFDGDLSKWNVWMGGAFNNELQLYQQSNLELHDGILFIHAKKDTVNGKVNPWENTEKTFNFTSGRIESKMNVSANNTTPKVRMAARIKLPEGYGLWPAFWSYGDPWPTQGEIDILEARGNEPTKYQTNYFYGTSAGSNLVSNAEGVIKTDGDLTSCYHVFELIWESSKLTTILDGTVVEVKTSGGYIGQLFGKQQRLTLNLAVGGLFFSNFDPTKITEGTMQVDWVKVYTSN
jgi:beta-glucanase (GH16 family)